MTGRGPPAKCPGMPLLHERRDFQQPDGERMRPGSDESASGASGQSGCATAEPSAVLRADTSRSVGSPPQEPHVHGSRQRPAAAGRKARIGKCAFCGLLRQHFAGRCLQSTRGRRENPQALRFRPQEVHSCGSFHLGGGWIMASTSTRLGRRRRSPTPRSRVGRGGCTDLVSPTPTHGRPKRGGGA